MKFLWPEMLWLLLTCRRSLPRTFILLRRKQAGRAPLCELEHGEGGDGHGPEISASHSAAAFPDCADRDDRRNCPSRRRHHLAIPAPNHHPRHGRLRQYARHRRAAQSNFRGAGRGESLCRRAALERSHRRGILCRDRIGRAAAHAKSRGHPCGDRSLPAATRHRHRQRDHRLAGDDLPGGGDRCKLIDLRTGRPTRHPARSNSARQKSQYSQPVPPGSYTSAAIILLTDGQRTTGPSTIEAAQMAADRGVRVFTVGIGTTTGETIGFEGWSMRVRLDEGTLKAIANLTHGEYFYAGTATELKKVYETLNSKLVLEKKDMEISALFSAAAAVIALVSAALSLLWFNRIL